MSAHRRPAIDFIITFNRINARSICSSSVTIDVLRAPDDDAHRRRMCIAARRARRTKIIAGVAVVAIDARRCIFGEESIFAHVFVDGLNLAVLALTRRWLLLRHEHIIVVRLVLALDNRRVDGRRRRANQVLWFVVEQLVGRASGGGVAQRRRVELVVVERIVVDARRGAADDDLRVGLHHAHVELLHLVEGCGCGGEIVCRSIAVLGGAGAYGAFFERSGFSVIATRLE